MKIESKEVRKFGATKIFDPTTTGMPYYDSAIENPKYYKEEKGIECKVVFMSPDEYIDRCYEMQKKYFKEPMSKELYLSLVINKDLVKKYAERMEKGIRFPIPVIDYCQDSQEGRNRAYAAKLLGVKEIPVLVCRKSEYWLDDR